MTKTYYQFLSICFGLLRFVSDRTILFQLFRNTKTNRGKNQGFVSVNFDTRQKHRDKPKKLFLVSRNNRNTTEIDLFRFVSVRTEIFCLFRGHPNPDPHLFVGSGSASRACGSGFECGS
jgi:hypothetical protein